MDGVAVGLAQVLEFNIIGTDLSFGDSRLEAVCWMMTSLLFDAWNAIIHIRTDSASDELFFRKDWDMLGYVWSSCEECLTYHEHKHYRCECQTHYSQTELELALT